MGVLEETFAKAVQDGDLPGVILLAKDKNGRLNYAKALGLRSLKPGREQLLERNSVLWLASVTKLMTSIAAMQLVEKGMISLEEDVSHLIPDLADTGIITGFDEAQRPIIKSRSNPLNLRHLLTHSAGAGYDNFDPCLIRYRIWQGLTPGANPTVAGRLGLPLRYEPGMSWAYGSGIDWAGKVIERLTGETLETYMTKNLWQPLGITGISFWPNEHKNMQQRLADMTIRDAESGRVVHNGEEVVAAEDCFGGHGAYGDLEDYSKILHSLLADDEVLLKRSTTAQMFQPQLTGESKAALNATIKEPGGLFRYMPGDFPHTADYDWGIGGLLVMSDGEGRRMKGTMIWGGLPNLFWFIDREAGITGVLGTQVMPPGDEKVRALTRQFELAMYELLAKVQLN